MGYVAIKDVRHATAGLIPKGKPWPGSEHEGARLMRLGLLREADVPVIAPDPQEAAAEPVSAPSSASLAARVSPQTTASESAGGGKKHDRKGKNRAASSSSTTDT